MPQSVIITTEEFFDNVGYFGDGDPIPLVSQAVVSAAQVYSIVDSAVVTSFGLPSDNQLTVFIIDVATVTGTAVITAAMTRAAIDQFTINGISVISAPDVAAFIDAATEMGVAAFVTAQNFAAVDAATLTGVATLSASEGGQASTEAFTVTGVAEISAVAIGGLIETNIVTGGHVILSTEITVFSDTAIETSIQAITFQEVYNTSNVFTDQNTVTAIAVPSAIDGKTYTDAATTTSTGVVSAALDIHTILDAATVTGINAIQQPLDLHAYGPDAATVTSVSSSSSVQTFDGVFASTITGVAVISAVEIGPSTGFVDSATVTASNAVSETNPFYAGYEVFDDFNRGSTSNGWGQSAVRGSAWTLLSGTDTNTSTTGTQGRFFCGNANAMRIATTITNTDVANGVALESHNILQSIDFALDVIPTGSGRINVAGLLGYVTDANQYYGLYVQVDSAANVYLKLVKALTGTESAVYDNQIGTGFPINTFWRLKVSMSGLADAVPAPTFSFKAWNLNSSSPSYTTASDTSGTYPVLANQWGVTGRRLAGTTNTPTLTFENYFACPVAYANDIGGGVL